MGKISAGNLERDRKIAAAEIGKPRPGKVIEALRRANIGRKKSAEHRRKLSIASRKRGAYPPAASVPWSKAEEKLPRMLPVAELAKRTGRTLTAAQHAVQLARDFRPKSRGANKAGRSAGG